MRLQSFEELLKEGECISPSSRQRLAVIPFPQADSVDLLLRVIGTFKTGGTSVYDLIGTGLVNTSRQALYYYNAAAFLGFCFRRGAFFYPTEKANAFLQVPSAEQASWFATAALATSVIGALYSGVLQYNGRQERLEWISQQLAPHFKSPVTLHRRAICMLSWLSWIQSHLSSVKK